MTPSFKALRVFPSGPSIIESMEKRQLLSAVLTSLASFTDGPAIQKGHVAIDASGDLFGVNFSNAVPTGGGYVWELPKTSAGYSTTVITLATLPADGSLGRYFSSGVVITPAGNLFGLGSLDDSNTGATGTALWEVPKTSTGYGSATLVETLPFSSTSIQMTVDPSGDLFGIGAGGDSSDGAHGELFEYSANGQLSDDADFDFTSPDAGVAGQLGAPAGGLASDAAGDIFGFAAYGGNILTTYQGSLGPVTQATGDVYEVPVGSHTLHIVASVPVVDADLLGGAYPEISVATVGLNTMVYGLNVTNAWVATVAGPAASSTAVDVGVFGPGGNEAAPGRATAVDSAGNLYGDDNTAVWEAAISTNGTYAAPQDVATFPNEEDGPISYLTSDGTNIFGTTNNTVFGVGPSAIPTVGGQSTTPTSGSTGTLSPTINKSTLPAQAVGGSLLKGQVFVSVSNVSTSKTTGVGTVSLYASATGALDASSTPVGTVQFKKVPVLNLNRSAEITFQVKTLPSTAGTYTFFARTTDHSGNTSVSAAGGTIVIAAPYVSLSAEVSAVKPTLPKVGKPVSFVVSIINSGNSDSTGQFTLTVGLSTDGINLTVPITTITKDTKFKANAKPTKITARFKLPTDLSFVNYFPYVSISQGSATATAVGPSFSPIFAAPR